MNYFIANLCEVENMLFTGSFTVAYLLVNKIFLKDVCKTNIK
jgi:hypothetical protein